MDPGITIETTAPSTRQQAVLDAVLELMVEAGDQLTMDAVASRAKASKATLYRRWHSKAALVFEAVMLHKGPATSPDTGSFRQDLI